MSSDTKRIKTTMKKTKTTKKKKNKKTSINRILVGKKIKEQMLSGQKVNISKAMREVGYSPVTAEKNVGKTVKSRECQAEIRDFAEQMEEIIQAQIAHMKKKQTKATFRDAVEALDKAKKLKQLETGKATDNIILVSWNE